MKDITHYFHLPEKQEINKENPDFEKSGFEIPNGCAESEENDTANYSEQSEITNCRSGKKKEPGGKREKNLLETPDKTYKKKRKRSKKEYSEVVPNEKAATPLSPVETSSQKNLNSPSVSNKKPNENHATSLCDFQDNKRSPVLVESEKMKLPDSTGKSEPLYTMSEFISLFETDQIDFSDNPTSKDREDKPKIDAVSKKNVLAKKHQNTISSGSSSFLYRNCHNASKSEPVEIYNENFHNGKCDIAQPESINLNESTNGLEADSTDSFRKDGDNVKETPNVPVRKSSRFINVNSNSASDDDTVGARKPLVEHNEIVNNEDVLNTSESKILETTIDSKSNLESDCSIVEESEGMKRKAINLPLLKNGSNLVDKDSKEVGHGRKSGKSKISSVSKVNGSKNEQALGSDDKSHSSKEKLLTFRKKALMNQENDSKDKDPTIEDEELLNTSQKKNPAFVVKLNSKARPERKQTSTENKRNMTDSFFSPQLDKGSNSKFNERTTAVKCEQFPNEDEAVSSSGNESDLKKPFLKKLKSEKSLNANDDKGIEENASLKSKDSNISTKRDGCVPEPQDHLKNKLQSEKDNLSQSCENAFKLLMSGGLKQSPENDLKLSVKKSSSRQTKHKSEDKYVSKTVNDDSVHVTKDKSRCVKNHVKRKKTMVLVDDSEEEADCSGVKSNHEVVLKKPKREFKVSMPTSSQSECKDTDDSRDTSTLDTVSESDSVSSLIGKHTPERLNLQLQKAMRKVEKAEKSLQKYLRMKANSDNQKRTYSVVNVPKEACPGEAEGEMLSHRLKVTLQSVTDTVNIDNSARKTKKRKFKSGKSSRDKSVSDADNSEESDSELIIPKAKKYSKYEEPVKLNHSQSSPSDDTSGEPKKRSSLFAYFNKVTKEEVTSVSKTEKISTKALVHSPPPTPSKKLKKSSNARKPLVVSSASKKRKNLRIISEESDKIDILHSEPINSESLSSQEKVDSSPPAYEASSRRLRSRSGTQLQNKDKKHDSSSTSKRSMYVVDDSSSDSDISIPNVPKTTPKESKIKEAKAPVKLAPIFLKNKLKKPDPAELERRKQFLSSGVPDVIRKMMELQRTFEESVKYETFPTVSHVQQRDDTEFEWNLPSYSMDLLPEPCDLTESDIPPREVVRYGTLTKSNIPCISSIKTKLAPPNPITSFRKILSDLKSEAPDFPIYRVFRKLRAKCRAAHAIKEEEVVHNDESKKKRNVKSRCVVSDEEGDKESTSNVPVPLQLPWTEKYKPDSVDDMFSNRDRAVELKCWLESWKKCISENRDYRELSDDSSGGEFICDSDSDDERRSRLPDNTAIIIGPPGSGKTAAVYTVANELGCEVLEINASSKRAGKQVLVEVQEATQSHRVKGSLQGNANISRMMAEKKADKKYKKLANKKAKKFRSVSEGNNESSGSNRKMSIILIEEADVVFDGEDEGFVSALSSLVVSSKRPVILVSNDPNCPHLVKFMTSHIVLRFTPYCLRKIGIWLQLVALLEGVHLSSSAVNSVLEWNKGDIRKTLNDLQFWVTSSGNYKSSYTPVPDSRNTTEPFNKMDIVDDDDDNSNMSWDVSDDKSMSSVPVISRCLESFLIFDDSPQKESLCPYPLNLPIFWWNIGLLNSDHSRRRLCRKLKDPEEEAAIRRNDFFSLHCSANDSDDESTSKKNDSSVDNSEDILSKSTVKCVTTPNPLRESGEVDRKSDDDVNVKSETGVSRKCSQEEMNTFFKLMDTVSYIDSVTSLQSLTQCGKYKNISSTARDQSLKYSTSLKDRDNSFLGMEMDFCESLVHHGVQKCLSLFTPDLESVEGQKVLQLRNMDVTLPSMEEYRWCEEQHRAENVSSVAISDWSISDPSAVFLDYIPILRGIGRAERFNHSVGTKRRNRYFSHLKGLGIHADSEVMNTMCLAFDESR